MYNSHRGMVPPAPSNRLAELMEQLRAEFETQAGRAGEYEHQSTLDLTYRVGSSWSRWWAEEWSRMAKGDVDLACRHHSRDSDP